MNRQSIGGAAAPAVRSTNFQCMLAVVVSRLTSTMSSSHSMPPPSLSPWPLPWWPSRRAVVVARFVVLRGLRARGLSRPAGPPAR